jgi:predicted nucleic acid-binding protein
VIVSDSGPLIAFSRIGLLDILELLFDRVLIPSAVYHEVVVHGRGRSGFHEVATHPWIQSRSVTDLVVLEQIPRGIHVGEREAIVLARELALPLLIDERRGRRFALSLGVKVFGSLRVVAEAHRQGVISDTASVAEAMIDSGYWIDPHLLSTLTGQPDDTL